MMVLLLLGALFAAFAIYNLATGDYANGLVGLGIGGVLAGLYFAQKKRVQKDAVTLKNAEYARCSRCGGSRNVRMRAYLICYSLIFFTSKSPAPVRPVCDSCRVTAGLPYSLLSLLFGWWGIPWGPIYTVQSIIQNFRGGAVVPTAPPEAIKSAAEAQPGQDGRTTEGSPIGGR